MATTSSSSSFTYKWTYDVFISFRGVDTRRGFIGNLFKELRQTKEIKAFMDDQDLEPGAEITPTLIKAIEESRIALVIFSKNYAASTYCLEELAKIMECSNKTGMLVWPVFYHVHPAEVRHHQKGSYAEALAKHEARNYEKQKLEKWKLALEKAAGLSGWHIRLDADKYEYEYIEEIIQKISKKISSWRDGDMNQQPKSQCSTFKHQQVQDANQPKRVTSLKGKEEAQFEITKVDPADVRYQRGSYAEALAKHEARFEKEKIKKWRAALKKAADRSGSHLRSDGYQYEYQFIDKIIQDISTKISSLRDGDKNKSFQLSGKKCYMIAARALSIVWGDAPEYWIWVILPESRFPEAAKLLKVCLLEICGVINTNALSPNTQYAAYLVFKMIDAYGFDLFPVELSVVIFGGQSITKNVCLDPYLEWWRLHYSVQGLQRPNVRSDGWFEIGMGEFFNSGLKNDEVRMSAQETKGGHWKCGLLIKGIEVRPKEGN